MIVNKQKFSLFLKIYIKNYLIPKNNKRIWNYLAFFLVFSNNFWVKESHQISKVDKINIYNILQRSGRSLVTFRDWPHIILLTNLCGSSPTSLEWKRRTNVLLTRHIDLLEFPLLLIELSLLHSHIRSTISRMYFPRKQVCSNIESSLKEEDNYCLVS